MGLKILLSTILIFYTFNLLAESETSSSSSYAFNRSPLVELEYTLLPLGDIKPHGWMRHTLEAMRDGITGHLDELWEDVGPNCGWIGGTGPAWERPVYWLDGLVPLAYILNDKVLIEKGQKYIEWILNSQREDGFFSQVEDTTRQFG